MIATAVSSVVANGRVTGTRPRSPRIVAVELRMLPDRVLGREPWFAGVPLDCARRSRDRRGGERLDAVLRGGLMATLAPGEERRTRLEIRARRR